MNILNAIDLGLPSGTLWCDRNIGASSPEDSGAFFSWGNTDPHYPCRPEEQDWGNISNAFNQDFSESSYKKSKGSTLSRNIDLAHDAAYVTLGAPWRMPTDKEFMELYNNCNVKYKIINNVYGILFTSRINKATIFFPASGIGARHSWTRRGVDGNYWTSSCNSKDFAELLYFCPSDISLNIIKFRYYGCPIRPVQSAQKEQKQIEINSVKETSAWKNARGRYLPKIDREVVALTSFGNSFKVAFAHRPARNSSAMTFGRGGWNIPDVKYWLDADLPTNKTISR